MNLEMLHYKADELHGKDILEGVAFVPWNLRPLTEPQFTSLGDTTGRLTIDQLAYLSCYGLLAPTTHNTVPQRFQLFPETGEIGIWLDRQLVLPASDVMGRQATISCGCCIAQIELAAAALGWETAVEVLSSVEQASTEPLIKGGPRFIELARLSFKTTMSTSDQSQLHAMLARKVVRAEYDANQEVTEQTQVEMQDVVQRYPLLSLHLITDTPTKIFLGKFQEQADTTVFNRDNFARELGDWLLPNDAQSTRGMRGVEFGLSDEAAIRFHRGLRRELQLLPDEIASLAKASNIGMRTASAVAVITSSEDNPINWIEAGRAYGELAVLLQRHNYVMSMHAAATEVNAPNMALRGRLRTRQRPVVVFRLGRILRIADGERPHASRPMLEAVLLPTDPESKFT